MKILVIIAIVTWILRFLPFLVFSSGRMPDWLKKLSGSLPQACMGMLVIYCFRNVSFTDASLFLPETAAGAVCVVLYVWKRNTLLSILLSTLFYMFLVQRIF
jgi:branched-subunit amino acid transport protein AzlD